MAKITPAISRTADPDRTARGPYRSINAPANGATMPNKAIRRPSGPDNSPTDQPNSREIGNSSTPGMLMTAELQMTKPKVSATMTQP